MFVVHVTFIIISIYGPVYCIVGVLQADCSVIRDVKQMFRLFCHEALRVFHDRLINEEDKTYFYGILAEMAGKHWGEVRLTWLMYYIG